MQFLSSVKSIFTKPPAEDKPTLCLVTNIQPQYHVYIEQSQLLDHTPPDLSDYDIATLGYGNGAETRYFSTGCQLHKSPVASEKEEVLVRVAVKLKTYLATCSNEELAKRFHEDNIQVFFENGDISEKRSLEINEAIVAQKKEKVEKGCQKTLLFRQNTADDSFSELLDNHGLYTLLTHYTKDELKEKFEHQFHNEPPISILPQLLWNLFIPAAGREIAGYEKRFHCSGVHEYKIKDELITYTFNEDKILYKSVGSTHGVKMSSVNLQGNEYNP